MPPVRICAGGDPSRKVEGRPYRDLSEPASAGSLTANRLPRACLRRARLLPTDLQRALPRGVQRNRRGHWQRARFSGSCGLECPRRVGFLSKHVAHRCTRSAGAGYRRNQVRGASGQMPRDRSCRCGNRAPVRRPAGRARCRPARAKVSAGCHRCIAGDVRGSAGAATGGRSAADGAGAAAVRGIAVGTRGRHGGPQRRLSPMSPASPFAGRRQRRPEDELTQVSGSARSARGTRQLAFSSPWYEPEYP